MKRSGRLLAVLLTVILSLTALTAHAEQITEVDALIEKNQMLEILKQIGVGFAETKKVTENEASTFALPQPKEVIYSKRLKGDIGVIDQVLYHNSNSWEVLKTWREGLLGSSDGTPLYCTDPTVFHSAGRKVSEDAALTYNKQTIQAIVAAHYYVDNILCPKLTDNYRYLFKQVGLWMVLDAVHHWFPSKVVLETGNDIRCPCGTWLAHHNGNLRHEGAQWIAENYKYFTDAWGIIYKGQGQPLSKWGGTYQPTGTLELIKHSANQEVSNNNGNYSLAGAVYGVYTANDKITPKYTITLDEYADGWGPAGVPLGIKYGYGKLSGIPKGEYYIKELTAPPGFARDERWYPSENTPLKIGEIAIVRQTVMDAPQMGTVDILVEKVDQETNINQAQGKGTLQGAHFEVKHYNFLGNSTVDPALEGKQPVKTWIFQTDYSGRCYFQKKYLVSGDAFDLNGNGEPALPLGTITIQEIRAPEGYHINPEIYVRQIVPNGLYENVNTYVKPTVPESILKLDLIKKQEHSEIRIADAVFEHRSPDGTTENVITDGNGTFTIKGLQYGEHRIREVKAPAGYQVNSNEIVFTVLKNNQIVSNSSIDSSKGTVTFQVTQEGNVSIIYEEKFAPYSLQLIKENDQGKKLEGAEFTLYKDLQGNQVIGNAVSDYRGTLSFNNLEVGKTYYLKETKAPKGYKITTDHSGNPVVYELYVESRPEKDEFIFYVDGVAYDTTSNGMFTVTGTKSDRVANMKIINEVGLLLPETGSNKMIPILLAGSMMIVYVVRKKSEVNSKDVF